ncbi:hypothetical protein [Cellulomonas sp. KRMCY2]|uniref:hypothetical protein n=1 Tax=Cellulomonas sp. KRMCY2 TaxID=1304865 RepID=UPI0004BB1A03|nr:hypothetical protein [Cellulomonas sp. KRMCY2]
MGTLADLVPAATAACVSALEPHTDLDWRAARAGDLDWSCWDTALHIADDLYFYAVQLVYGRAGPDYLSTELALDSEATVPRLLDAIVVHGELLRRAAVGADAKDRGYHIYGVSDSEGFAAMGIAETLVHTYDIIRGLVPTTTWRPPAELADHVLRRLFPAAPSGDPSDVLLYSCGRMPLGDRPRQDRWRWDGSVPTEAGR